MTDDKVVLRERLEAATGERIAALEAVEPDKAKGREARMDSGRNVERDGRGSGRSELRRIPEAEIGNERGARNVERDLTL